MKPLTLIVEDDRQNAQLMRTMLARLDTEVVVAHDAHSALKLLNGITPALVIMDLRLPGELDGWQLTARLRSYPALARTPIIVVSAFSSPSDIQRAKQLGCNEYLTKPVRAAHFLAVVGGHLEPYIPA